MKKLLLSATAAVAVALAASTPASAAFLDGLADGYSVESGVSGIISLSSDELAGEEASFSPASVLVPTGFTSGIIILLDPASEGGLESDRFGIRIAPTDPTVLFIGMISDGASAADIATFNTAFSGVNGNILATLTETGLSQDVTHFFSADPAFIVQVVSDVPAVSVVPEPVTIAVLGVGLLGLGLVRRRA